MLAEEGKRNWVLVVALVIIILFIGGVIASFLSTPALEPPSAIRAELKDGGVSLSWEPPAVEVDGYRIYRALPGQQAQLIAEVVDNIYLDTSVEEGKEYTYYLTSYRKGEESVKSAPVSIYIEPFPPTDVRLSLLDVCGGDGNIVVSFSAKNADGCSFSFDAKEWQDYPLSASPITLRPPAYLSQGGESYLYMKCYRVVDGKRVESDLVKATITGDVMPPQLYGDVKVEEGKAIIKVSSDEELEGCTAFAGPQPLGSFEKEATFALPPGEYLLTISCKDKCGNTNFLAYPVENNYQEIEVNNTTYRIGLEINNGAASTTSREVVLNIISENFKECRFANDEDVALNAWSSWEPASSEWEKPWVLAACDGKRSVYMQCRDGDVSYTVKDSIYCGVMEENATENESASVTAYAMGVVDKYIVADNTIQPILAGDLEDQSVNLLPYVGGFFVFSHDGSDGGNAGVGMHYEYTGGFFVFNTPKVCNQKNEPRVEVVRGLDSEVTSTGEVILTFSTPVDYVEVYRGPVKVAEGKVDEGTFVVPRPSAIGTGDVSLDYHWKAYRMDGEQRQLVGEGDVSILWDRTPPEATIQCDNSVARVNANEPLQVVIASMDVGGATYYCVDSRDTPSFAPPSEAGYALTATVVDRAGHKVVVDNVCSYTPDIGSFLPLGLIQECSPVEGDVVCRESYAPYLSAGLEGKVTFPAPVEGMLVGFSTSALRPECTTLPTEMKGTFTADVPDGSEVLHSLSFIPCEGGRPNVAGEVKANVLIDKAPPTISSAICSPVEDGSLLCSISASDRSGISAYKVEVCYGDPLPIGTEGEWCDGKVDSASSSTPTLSLPRAEGASAARVYVWDSVGNVARRTIPIGSAAPTLSLDVKGSITYHRLDVMEVEGGVAPQVVTTSTVEGDELTSNPVVKVNALYSNIDSYAFELQHSHFLPFDGPSGAVPVPATLELPAMSGLWKITLKGIGSSTISAYDTIYLDVSPPTITLDCGFGENNTTVVCSYYARDNLALPSPSGLGFGNDGISHVDVVVATRPKLSVGGTADKVVATLTLSESTGAFEVELSPEDDGKEVLVWLLAEDMAGNYRLSTTSVGFVSFPETEVSLEAVGVVRRRDSGALFASIDDRLLSPTYVPVFATNRWDNLYVAIYAKGAEECTYSIEPGYTGGWEPYTSSPAYYPLEALTTSEGIYRISAQCRAMDYRKGEHVYSNRLSTRLIVDQTPPDVVVKVVPSIAETTPPLEPTLADEEGEVVAYLWQDDGSCCAYTCNPDYGDLEGCTLCCGDFGGGSGGDTGGGGSSCNYGACPTPYEEVTPLFPLTDDILAGSVSKRVVVPPFSYISDAYCRLVLKSGDIELYKGQCNTALHGATSCCSGSTQKKTQEVEYEGGIVASFRLPRICDSPGRTWDVYIKAYELIGNPDFSTTWQTHEYYLGSVSCEDYYTNESNATEGVDGLNTLKISAEDALSGISLVIVYKQMGAYDGKLNVIKAIDDYRVAKTYILPTSTSLTFEDVVTYNSDADVAEDGYLFYRYKVVAYDKAGNKAEVYTDWVAPYSLPSSPPV